ncbi:MAG: hypothetical protein A3E01_15245 [Gammaproteobacteria bacterium RIFCSPHIGHO2_12_FULL_63_22]|nr:MAG: hypothetical protein A3E01_15245 [Gammaproteobacteria bacterium RIFCSPHIGHO2_12_FULL_63_22]
MIAAVSRSRRPRLFAYCRVKRCRSVATETLNAGAAPFWCGKHLSGALALTSSKPLTMAEAKAKREGMK